MVYGDGVYGECGPYGEDCVTPPTPVPYDPSHCDICGEGWRVEATDLSTGIVKAVLHPISMEWEEPYSKPGQGTIMISTEDPSADDIWPHTTGIYISRVIKDDQGKPARYGHFGGYVEKFSGSGGGTTTLGLKPMDEYPYHRLLADDDEGLAYSTPGYVDDETPGPGKSQTQIAVDLINIAIAGKGKVPIVPTAGSSTQLRVRHWDIWEFKNLGEAIRELTDDISGVKYTMTHQFFEAPARWETRLHFVDTLNIDRGIKLRGDYEGWQYGLEVDATNQANRVYGVGTGEGATQMFSIAYDADGALPEFQSTLAWKDIAVPASLDNLTRGAVTENRDPVSVPGMTLVGLEDVPPDKILPGDIVTAEIGYGVITYRGEKARVSSITWRLAVDEPLTRTLALLPIIRPSLSVKTQVPAKIMAPVDPEQTANPPALTPIAPPPPPKYPGQLLDLSYWKLTLPTGSSGDPDEITQPKLATYSHPDFFHTIAGPAVKFKAPQKGVTTPNSKNTRTELREMKPGGKDRASWSNKSGTHTLEAELAFIHGPSSKPHVVTMQIHDADDDVTVLRFEGSDVWFTNGDSTHGHKLMSGYVLGTYMKMKVVASGGRIRWYRNDQEVWSLSKSISGAYFKAGCYQQAGNSGPDYGEVHFKSLKVTHS